MFFFLAAAILALKAAILPLRAINSPKYYFAILNTVLVVDFSSKYLNSKYRYYFACRGKIATSFFLQIKIYDE